MDNVTSIVNTIGVNQAVNPANLKTNLYFPLNPSLSRPTTTPPIR